AQTGTEWAVVHEEWQQAQKIRRHLTELLPDLRSRNADLDTDWWYYATLAEAHFGLAEFDKAIAELRKYNVAVKLTHPDPPLEKLAAWEFESTLTQLASLAQLQSDLAGLLEKSPKWKGCW